MSVLSFSNQKNKEIYFNQPSYNAVIYDYGKEVEIVKTNTYFRANVSGVQRVSEENKVLKDTSKDTSNTSKEYKRSDMSIRRTRRNIRRLLQANSDMNRFVTLTYRENQTDRDSAYNDFKNFFKRLRYRYGDIKYLGVVEYQKRGAIHFHFFINKFIPIKSLEKVWGHGFVKINLVRGRQKLLNYVRKYVTKEGFGVKGKKLYSRSRNLKTAKKTYTVISDVEDFMNFIGFNDIEIVDFDIPDTDVRVTQAYGMF